VVTRAEEDRFTRSLYRRRFLGVLFLETEKGRKSYIREVPILDIDLVDEGVQL